MEQNSDETTANGAAEAATGSAAEQAAAGEAPTTTTRRRATRRVTTAAAAPEPSTQDAQSGAAETAAEAPAEAPKKRATRTRKKATEEPGDAAVAEAAAQDAQSGAAETAAEAPAEAPKKRATRTRKKTEEPAEAPATGPDASPDAASGEAAVETAPATRRTTARGRKSQAAKTEAPAENGAEAASPVEAPAAAPQIADTAAAEAPAADQSGVAESDTAEKPRRTRRSRGQAAEEEQGSGADGAAKAQADRNADKGASEKSADEQAPQPGQSGDRGEDAGDAGKGRGKGKSGRGAKTRDNRDGKAQGERQNDRGATDGKTSGDRSDGAGGDRQDRGDKNGESSRSTRTRQRDRKRRGQGDDFEPEIAEDDVLLPVAGILDVLDNYAFVRTSGYLPGTSDVYVSLGQVKKYGLRKGDAVVGSIRQPREGEGGGRQKYNAIVGVDTINGRPLDEDQNRKDFSDLTPLYPQDRVRLDQAPTNVTRRVVDVVAPIGFGQRALVVGPTGSGKSALLREIADAVSANHPDAHLMMVVAGERPEEVTQLQRSVNGEVVASTFDRSAEDHTTVAELAVERAKRLVELGHDVVVLLESVNQLAHSYAQSVPTGGRGSSDDPQGVAELQVKRLLAAARNLENAGSLTIIATVQTKSGVKSDKDLLRALAPVVNGTVTLSGSLASRWLFPAVDVAESGVEREEVLRGEGEMQRVHGLRRELARKDEADALEDLIERVGGTASTAELLARVPVARTNS